MTGIDATSSAAATGLWLWLAFSSSFFGGCAPSVRDVYACDLYGDGECTLHPPAVYRVPRDSRLPSSLKTWTDFSHHLYFHSRITPGLRVDLRHLGQNERRQLEQASCHWTLEDPGGRRKSVNGTMEGKRSDAGGLWCFDYLGTMLLAYVRENGLAAESVHTGAVFPLRLHMTASTGFSRAAEPAIERLIDLQLPDPTDPDRSPPP